MSSEIAKTIVDQIANGKLDAAKESVFTGMKEKAAEEMRKAAGASFDDFDLEDGIDSMDPDLKRNLMNEMFHVIELELPFIGTT